MYFNIDHNIGCKYYKCGLKNIIIVCRFGSDLFENS